MNQLQTQIRTNLLIGPAFIGPALFLLLSTVAHSEIRIAIVDTGFCPEKIKTRSIIKIEKAIDLTESVKLDCHSSRFDKLSPRFHGQLVLEEFIKSVTDKTISLTVFPLIVFNQRGDQRKEYWEKAIDWIKKNQIDLVVTAAGFITKERIVNELPGVWFVPSGRISPQIKKGVELFPQNLAPMNNLFVIGDFYDGRSVLYDQALLYQDKIDYYFPSGLRGFKGTSKAVAEAAGRAVSICSLSSLRACLKKKSKEYLDGLSNRKIQTY